MRLFLFKILFKLTWWAAPNRELVDRLFRLYTELVKMEEQKKRCEERQREMDKCIRPRTETYERHTIRDQGSSLSSATNRRRYTDYDEATQYHNKGKGK